MRYSLILVFFIGTLLFGCKNETSRKQTETKKETDADPNKDLYEDPESSKYSITAPEGWTKERLYSNRQEVTLLVSPLTENDNFRENITVSYESMQGLDKNSYIDKSVSIVSAGLVDFVEISRSDKQMSELEYSYVKYTHNYNGANVEVDQYYTMKDGTSYIITCSAKGGANAEWEKQFEDIIRTFRLK